VRTLSAAPSWALLVAPCKLPRAAPNTAPKHGACGDANRACVHRGARAAAVRSPPRSVQALGERRTHAPWWARHRGRRPAAP
jgi:hypothetical protein